MVLSFVLAYTLLGADGIMPITDLHRDKFVRLIRSDRDAARLFLPLKRLADSSLNDVPHPIRRIVSAGRLASDPAKAESRAALEDMKKLAAFGYAYVATTNASYSMAAKRMVLAWAQTNEPSGVPIDETQLEPLFTAYGLTRPEYATAERETVENWLRKIAQKEREGMRPHSATSFNNWNSHRLKIIGMIGFLLEDPFLISQAVSGFKRQIQENLRPDGSSFDFHERDALRYHCYNLEPLLTLAIAAHAHGEQLYDYRSPDGASLRKSVHFLVPYCEGVATHAEWVHSKVDFDRKRAEAGEAKFKIGSNFDARDGLRVLELASFFDEGLKPLVARLVNREDASYPTWQLVLNEACQP